MATRIRLRRVGRKHHPCYRIVVADKRAPRDGRFIETLGHYDPCTEPATLVVNAEKAREWLAKGATPSDTVRSLLKKAGVFSDTPPVPVSAEAPAPLEAEADASVTSEAVPEAEPSAESGPADA
ncbi:MAG: 30S ribosomal protein S16 [Gemmatimonadetes bacterium]|nr:30S ribosomal protein S16 [Gemmatimonadota bacterium]